MREHKKILLAKCKPPAIDPRVSRDPAALEAMADSLKRLGQQCPLLVYRDGECFVLLDGMTRWAAAQLAGLTELDAIVLDQPPSAADQALIVAAIDVHRTSLSAIERARQLSRIQKERGCGVGELAALVSMSQSTVSKLLPLLTLSPAVQQKLESGDLDLERGYLISQEPDHAKQLQLAVGAASLDREQLRQKVRGQTAAPAKTASARFLLTTGMAVTVQGRDVCLSGAIDALNEAVKELKKALSQNLDIVTAQRVMKDKSKARA